MCAYSVCTSPIEGSGFMCNNQEIRLQKHAACMRSNVQAQHVHSCRGLLRVISTHEGSGLGSMVDDTQHNRKRGVLYGEIAADGPQSGASRWTFHNFSRSILMTGCVFQIQLLNCAKLLLDAIRGAQSMSYALCPALPAFYAVSAPSLICRIESSICVGACVTIMTVLPISAKDFSISMTWNALL